MTPHIVKMSGQVGLEFGSVTLAILSMVLTSQPSVAVEQERAPQQSNVTIAVASFQQRNSKQSDNDVIVTGMHHDLIAALGTVNSLTVISHDSIARLADRINDPDVVRQSLSADSLVFGDIEVQGDRIALTVKLMDVETGSINWRSTYERQLNATNLYRILANATVSIAENLGVAISDEESDRIRNVPTENLDAYRCNHRGRAFLKQGTTDSIQDARREFRCAIQLDGGYWPAHIGLANSYLQSNTRGDLRYEQASANAKSAIILALKLNPSSAEAYASLGWLRHNGDEYASAEIAFNKALELNPNYAATYLYFGDMLRHELGRAEESLALRQRGLLLDPLSPSMHTAIAYDLASLGRYDEALAEAKTAVSIDPTATSALDKVAWLYQSVYGRLDLAINVYQRVITLEPENPMRMSFLAQMYLDIGDPVTASLWAQEAHELAPENRHARYAAARLALYRGDGDELLRYAQAEISINHGSRFALLILRNSDMKDDQYAKARSRYERAFPELLFDIDPKIEHRNYEAAINLAAILQKTGEENRANLLLGESLAYVDTIYRLGDLGFWIADVEIYALQGKKRLALAALRVAIEDGWRFQWWALTERNPNLAMLHDDPEYRSLIADITADMAAQRRRLQEQR